MTVTWNYGDILDAVGDVVPGDRPALIHGDRVVTWSEFVARSNNLAANMLGNGAKPNDKIAIYMRNRPEYLEGLTAAFKARLTHVNVNYRYIDNELIYLLDNADATVCIYAAEFAPNVAQIRGQLPQVTQWIEVDDGHLGLEDALHYEDLATTGDGATLTHQRSPNDQLFIYTGGTTGM
ncbi:MAG: AMP-binding protein, partial [SAR86 cluster bacterium]|nr:AMP-binding protein [SAR86 cluster bacterium]